MFVMFCDDSRLCVLPFNYTCNSLDIKINYYCSFLLSYGYIIGIIWQISLIQELVQYKRRRKGKKKKRPTFCVWCNKNELYIIEYCLMNHRSLFLLSFSLSVNNPWDSIASLYAALYDKKYENLQNYSM